MKDYIARSEKDVWMFVDMLLRKKKTQIDAKFASKIWSLEFMVSV